MKIKVGARSSPLSIAQVQEVFNEIQIPYQLVAVTTYGDRDRTTSLRTLDKTNFFTKEIDDMLLKGECQIAVHSAKDLPDPLPEGLEMVALTKGVDPSDSLVLAENFTIDTLPQGACIATSSERREEACRKLRPDLTFCDVRGTISERLDLLGDKILGVVIAEAALIRLNLTHLNRITLPGKTAPLQGRLAILAREGDKEMHSLFSNL